MSKRYLDFTVVVGHPEKTPVPALHVQKIIRDAIVEALDTGFKNNKFEVSVLWTDERFGGPVADRTGKEGGQ
jgi:hypothetical protein